MSDNELAIVYAALILADDGVEITAEKLQTLTKTAGIDVEPVWANLFAKALEGKNVSDLLMNVGSEKPQEEEKPADGGESSDEDMGLGMFFITLYESLCEFRFES
ncbi:7047_t:CDS:2 [Cetraspora pellucida]|uniref:7047_t:CDS:1 n=1 Tax=Cetraspora pellucida TaxID=1433469 RepID=A0ACA9M1Q6_9GLOM|nr:7047_t:CDS:2 [Cetraspora pellucida]